MSYDQAAIFAILVGVFVLFVWGRWRHDIVAFLALLAAVGAGVVPFADAFRGFGHPATVTVAMVLVMSRALSATLGGNAIIDDLDDLASDAERRDDGPPPTEVKRGEMRASAITVRFVAVVLLLYMAAVVGYFVYDQIP